MSTVVLHVRKLKQTNTIGVIKHNKRDFVNYGHTKQNINVSKSGDNFYYGMGVKELLNEYKTNLKPQCFRANIVPMVEVIFSFSADYKCNLEEWFKANIEYAKSVFGENVLSLDLHTDEKTPHIHCLLKPIVDEKLNAKQFITKGLLKSMQNNYPKFMQSKGFNLERGLENSSVKHVDQKHYSNSVNRTIEQTNKNTNAFVDGLKNKVSLRFKNKNALSLVAGKNDFEEEIKKDIDDYCKKEFTGYSNALNELKQANNKLQQQAKAITKEKDKNHKQELEKIELRKQLIQKDEEVKKLNKELQQQQEPEIQNNKLELEIIQLQLELEKQTQLYTTTLKAFNELQHQLKQFKEQSKDITLKQK